VFAPYLTVSFYSTDSGSSKPIPASKVFYRSITATEGNTILENASMSTEELRLPTEALTELLNTLAGNTMKMPQSARKFREWDVGVLERFIEGMDE
jgi:ubiquitin-protein ligase E3 D